MSKENDELLEATLKEIQKQFGRGAVMKLGESTDANVEALPSGILPLDLALGIGGYPKGRVIEVFGPESSGKTTIALHAVAETQKNGGRVAFIDAEHALDPIYAKNLGVDLDELILSQPDSGEQAMQICDLLIKSNAIDLIIVDSVAALVPQAELDGEMEDQQMGLQARLMSKALRKIVGNLSKSKCSIIFINQLREKIQQGYGPMLGGNETTSGGRALKFSASIRLDVRKIETLKRNGEPIGHKLNIKVVKNKVAPPFKVATCSCYYGEGISRINTIIDIAIENGIIEKSGSWFAYNGEKIGQGKENVKLYLLAHHDIYENIDSQVVNLINKKEAHVN